MLAEGNRGTIQARIRKSDKGKTENTDIRATEGAAEGVRLCGRETKKQEETNINKQLQYLSCSEKLQHRKSTGGRGDKKHQNTGAGPVACPPSLLLAKNKGIKLNILEKKQQQENKGESTKKLEGSSGCV